MEDIERLVVLGSEYGSLQETEIEAQVTLRKQKHMGLKKWNINMRQPHRLLSYINHLIRYYYSTARNQEEGGIWFCY